MGVVDMDIPPHRSIQIVQPRDVGFVPPADGLVGCHPLLITGSASGNVHNYHRLNLNRLSYIPPSSLPHSQS